MTFLTTRYRLAKPLTTKELERLGSLTTILGILGVSIEDQDLVVQYDGSRLHEVEVLATVRKTGIAVSPYNPIPAGAYDESGPFKDYAWPTEGLSPVNRQD